MDIYNSTIIVNRSTIWYYKLATSKLKGRDYLKKLFTIKCEGLFSIERENEVYSVWDTDSKKITFYDYSCNELPDYQRSHISDDEYEEQFTDDNTQISPIVNGFYNYSTHKVEYDVDEMYGMLGIKDKNGNKLTEEIYYQIGSFSNGLCSVRLKDTDWGCINEKGELIIPYKFGEELNFNIYGVACGDSSLVDISGNAIPDTTFNCIGDCFKESRYFTISLLTDEQSESIDRCGTAPDIKEDIYDTKKRKYVAKNIPDLKLDVSFFNGDEDVILAAIKLIDDYDKISIEHKGTIIAEKDDYITVFDYYQNA